MIAYQGIDTLEILKGADKYNSWIAGSFTKYLKSPFLEIGAGTGNISQHFLHLREVGLSDIDPGLVSYMKKRFSRKKNVYVHKLDIVRLNKKKLSNQYNTILAINVLEHIADDIVALKNMNTLLKKNGRVCLLVPAKMLAYTSLDKVLGHYRRYEKQELQYKLEQARFRIEKLYYFNIVGLASWILRDKVEKTHSLKPYQVALFDNIVPVLQVIESILPPPIGISMIAIARKS